MPETTETPRYRTAWQARQRRYSAFYGILVLAGLALYFADELPIDPVVTGVTCIIVILCASRWIDRFPCPRCGEIFSSQWLQKPGILDPGPRKCEPCGLALIEIPSE